MRFLNTDFPTRSDIARLFGVFCYLSIPAIIVYRPVEMWDGIYWAMSILAFSVFIYLTIRQLKWSAGNICLVVFFIFIFELMNLILTTSFMTQGKEFNTAFFNHFDLSTLSVGWKTEPLQLIFGIGHLLLAPVVVIGLVRRFGVSTSHSIRVMVALCLALTVTVATNFPVRSYASHLNNTRITSERMTAEIAKLREVGSQSNGLVKGTRNLVLIYLESFEQNYLDQELFPGLTPNINNLRQQAIQYRNVQQFPGTGWTIAGIVSSQCGVPLLTSQGGNLVLTKVDNPFRSVTCLAEYLKEDGYSTAFMGGGTLDFAGKRRFFADNGFDVALGIDEAPTADSHRWGMYDNVMYAKATELFDGLEDAGSPFLLSLLTLDTHHPYGTPSSICLPYGDGEDLMLTAVHCADQQVFDFIEHIRSSSIGDDTVIAVMSDHLVINGAIVEPLSRKNRLLNLFILDPSRAPAVYDAPVAHFDIGPTLLAALGKDGAAFYFGHSVLNGEQGRVFEQNLTEDDFMGFSIEALLLKDATQ